MTAQARQPAGTPVGGQFSTATRPEAALTLVGKGYDPPPAPAETRPSDRSPEHAQLAALGVGEGKLSLLAPVEAKTLWRQVSELALTDRAKVRGAVDAYLHWRDLADHMPVYEARARRIVDESTRQYAAARLGFADAQDAARRGDTGADIRADEAQADLSAAVRRYDDARADLRYLTDPAWRDGKGAVMSMNDHLALDSARRRFAASTYRGQVF